MRKWSIGMCVGLLFISAGAVQTQAQSVDYASASDFNERIKQLEIELASYKNAIESVCADDCDLGCGSTCLGDTCSTCCKKGGITGGASISFVKPFHTDGQTANCDYTGAPSVWLGYQAADGLGVRARWWEVDANGPNNTRYDQIHMRLIDLEVTDTFRLGRKLNGLVSGGFRYAEYREDEATGAGFLSQQHAMGLVVGTELRRNIAGGFSLFGLGRTSFLFSESNLENGAVQSENTTFSVSELQLGLEYSRPIFDGNSNMFARVAAETQYWNGVSDDDSEDVSLLGFGFAFGVTR